MSVLYPAILIGGPPHSGKSTLAYRLSEALKQRQIAHYLLRASPDGEGTWSYTAQAALVPALRERARAGWTPALAALLARDITNRQLPLLVDVGGKPSAETAQIAERCTHAILLASNVADLESWWELIRPFGLIPIAELTSQLAGSEYLTAQHPYIKGTVTGLQRDLHSKGVALQALIEWVASICTYDPAEIFRYHLTQLPFPLDLVLHIEQPIYPLPAHTGPIQWQPEELPDLIASLPHDQPIGIYGRGPNWLYAALATIAPQYPCLLFDPRQGWITPPTLLTIEQPETAQLTCAIQPHDQQLLLQFAIPTGYLELQAAAQLAIPAIPAECGVILDGKLPLWLWVALARAYHYTSMVAIYQPTLHAAVVISSNDRRYPIGTRLPI